jgi:hypothetical protein
MKNSTYSRRNQTVSTVKAAGHDPRGLLAKDPRQDVAARRGAGSSPWRRRVVRDRGGRDPHAKPEELALDALVAPPRVLRGEADNQLLDVVVQWWPAGLAMRVGPRAGDQPAVPAQQRLRLDEEAGPPGSGQDAADRGEQGPVGRFQPGTRDLATQDGELVAEHHDLQVFGGITAGGRREQLDGAPSVR